MRNVPDSGQCSPHGHERRLASGEDRFSTIDHHTEEGLVLGSTPLKIFIDKGADLAPTTEIGDTALIVAAKKGHVDRVRTLVKHMPRSMLNHADSNGMTAAMWAATSQTEESLLCLQALVDAGAELDMVNKSGSTALMLSLDKKNLDVVRLLVEGGADLTVTRNGGGAALIVAVKKQHVGCVKSLAQRVPSSALNLADSYRRTPLMWAATFQTAESLLCLRALMAAGAELEASNESGRTALMLALDNKNLDASRALLEGGAKLEARDNDGRTALMYAARVEGFDSAVTLLLDWRAELEHRDKEGQTVLMLAIRFGNLAAVNLLLDRGAELEAKDNDGLTPLVFAVRSGDEHAVNLLLERRPLLDTITRSGHTPLKTALDHSEYSIAVKLLMLGADPTASPHHRDFLHNAVSCEADAVTQALIENGFPPLDVSLLYFKSPPGRSRVWNRAHKNRQNVKRYLETTPLSPLAVALLCLRPCVARYFILNRFLTRFDLVRLCWDRELRRLLETIEATQSLEILDILSARPHSLLTLSLVAISSVLCQFLFPPVSTGEDLNLPRPTFRERVERLGLPVPVQRYLLHRTACGSASINRESWCAIRLDDVIYHNTAERARVSLLQ